MAGSASVSLIGRNDELRLIDSRLAAAGRSEGSVVLISGEVGIGKSRFLRELIQRDRGPQVRVAIGQCYDYLQSPFGPFLDILGDLRDADPSALDRLSEVRDIVEALTSASGAAAVESIDKRRLFLSLRQAFDAYAIAKPLLLALDDIQWADGSTLDLLQFLAERAPRSRIVIVATYRSGNEAQSDRLRLALSNLGRGASAFHRSLGPLADREIRRLLRSAAVAGEQTNARRIASVAQHADGNPLLAEELFKTADIGDADGVESLPLPVSVHAATLARLSGLEPAERRMIVAAAAIGRQFTPGLLAEVAGVPVADVHEVLSRAAQLDLVEPSFDATSLRFRHELTRRAVYDELLPDEARALHRSVAAALEIQPATPQRVADLAYHYWMGADVVKAADFNEESGNRAFALYSFAVAAENYDRALRCLGDDQTLRAAVILEKRGHALYQIGQSDAAATAHSCARLYYESEGAVEPIARLSVKLATLRWNEGREAEALAECTRALDLVDERSPSFFRAHAYLGLFLVNPDIDAAMPHFELAERFTGPREPDDALILYQCRALALGTRGDADGMEADYRRAGLLAREICDFSTEIRCLGNLGFKLTDLGERVRALAAFDEAATIIEREELWDVDCSVCLRQNAWACVQFGDLRAAHDLIVRALEFPVESPRLKLFAAQTGILIGLRTMDDDLLRRFDDPALPGEPFEHGNESMLITALTFAERDFAVGRAVEGAEMLHRLIQAYSNIQLARDEDGTFILAALHGSDADAEQARTFVARFADDTKTVIGRAHLSLYDAAMARRRGDIDAATTFAAQAREIYETLGWRWHVARSLEFGGELDAAMQVYNETGDVRAAQRLHEALNPVNRRGRAKSDLTDREREIAELAAAGRTNRQIAENLSLSERTVESHLRSVFNKLSVRGKSELIARWRDLTTDAAQVSP